ncbi:hypothetical protein [Kingella oralis]|uniref:hypothetical protein n=1 Tax=Kingella oralis TaxID=505 RepID=UPI0034E45B24
MKPKKQPENVFVPFDRRSNRNTLHSFLGCLLPMTATPNIYQPHKSSLKSHIPLFRLPLSPYHIIAVLNEMPITA